MISDLPEDLESQILAMVPTKSLVQLQTTCKRWYNLFKDPDFVKKNLGKSTREVILRTSYGVYSIIVNHDGIDPSVEFRGKLRTLEDYEELKISQIFHCNGLILCVTRECTRIDVWNPCTGETRRIKPRSSYHNFDMYALGYENINSSCHSYKILRFYSYYNEERVQVAEFEIYESSSDSWRVIDGYSSDYCFLKTLGVSLKENAYWIAYDEETGFFLLHFDFTTERFGRLPLPYQSHDYFAEISALSVVKDEKLSVLYQNFSMKIWVTNKIVDTKNMSWSNFLVVDFHKFMSPSVPTVRSFLLDEENKVVVCCGKDLKQQTIKIYIVGENIYKEVYKKTTEFQAWPHLVSYVPSLVKIPKNTLKGERK